MASFVESLISCHNFPGDYWIESESIFIPHLYKVSGHFFLIQSNIQQRIFSWGND